MSKDNPNDELPIMQPTESEFKGNPILALPTDTGREVRFGIAKAKTIIKHIEAIKSFVEKHSK